MYGPDDAAVGDEDRAAMMLEAFEKLYACFGSKLPTYGAEESDGEPNESDSEADD